MKDGNRVAREVCWMIGEALSPKAIAREIVLAPLWSIYAVVSLATLALCRLERELAKLLYL